MLKYMLSFFLLHSFVKVGLASPIHSTSISSFHLLMKNLLMMSPRGALSSPQAPPIPTTTSRPGESKTMVMLMMKLPCAKIMTMMPVQLSVPIILPVSILLKSGFLSQILVQLFFLLLVVDHPLFPKTIDHLQESLELTDMLMSALSQPLKSTILMM